MNCRETRDSLEDFRDDLLNSAARKSVLDHLAECATCRREMAEADAVDAQLRVALGESAPAPDFVSRVMRQVSQVAPPRAVRLPRTWPRLAAVAASLLVVAGMGLLALRTKPDTPARAPSPDPAPAISYEPARDGPIAIGPAFVIGKEGNRAYAGKAFIRVRRVVRGTPELIVEAFPKGS